jgi:hypothetical protein
MKIIEISKDWKEPTFEEVTVKCTSCGSKLSIEAKDIKVGYNNRISFECPVCFNDSKLDKDVEYKYWNYNRYIRDKRKRMMKNVAGNVVEEKDEVHTQSTSNQDSKQESKENLDMIIKEVGYWAKQCE